MNDQSPRVPKKRTGDSRSSPSAADLAAQVLSESDEPMHYAALAREVLLRGARLIGKTPWMSLRTSLSRDERFERVGGQPRTGMYALASWPREKKLLHREQILSERRRAAAYRKSGSGVREALSMKSQQNGGSGGP